MEINDFDGISDQPDPDSVGSRYSRNVMIGSNRTWIETRPGSEQMSQATYPGVEDGSGSLDSFYAVSDSRLANMILLVASPYGDLEDIGSRGASNLVHDVRISPLALTQDQIGNQDPPTDDPLGPEAWMLAGSAYTVNRTTRAVTEYGSFTEVWILCTDQTDAVWFATRSGSTVSVRYRIGEDNTVAGTISSSAALAMYAVPKASGSGCWLMVVDTDLESATLYDVTTGAVSTVSAILSAGYTTFAGLSWCADGDLACIGLQSATDDLALFKFSTAGVIRANYPSKFGSGVYEGQAVRAGQALQLGPSGTLYCYLRDVTGNGGDGLNGIYSFVPAVEGLTGLSIVVDFGLDTQTFSSCAFTVLATADIVGTYEGGESNQFLFTYDAGGENQNVESWADASGNPSFDCGEGAVWQTATAVFVNGLITGEETVVARIGTNLSFQGYDTAVDTPTVLQNTNAGRKNTADQNGTHFRAVVLPQLP